MGASLSQARVPATSPLEIDPRKMPVCELDSVGLKSGADLATSAAFWTTVDRLGDYQTASPDGVTRTIMNVTGRGSLIGVIGPAINAIAGTTTFTITRDGVACALAALPHATAGTRMVLGDCLHVEGLFTTATREGGLPIVYPRSSNGVWYANSTSLFQLIDPRLARRIWSFDVSMKVEVISTTISGLALSAYCGALWALDN